MNRYSYITEQVEFYKPQIILEIGTFHGHRAEAMVSAALKYNQNIQYYGFDLFDDFKEFQKEFCYKGVAKIEEVKRRLARFNNINLIKGNTRETLKSFDIQPDFVFIDGGHSLETIESDWNNVLRIMKKNTVVIFDDYYHNRSDVGAKKIVSEISENKSFKVTLHNSLDHCTDERFGSITIGLAKVEFTQ